MSGPLDLAIERLEAQLNALSRREFASFFAYAAERLFGLYAAIEAKHHWGDSIELRHCLDRVWSSLVEDDPSYVPSDLIDRLASLVPADEFGSPDSMYAESAVVCVDAAVRAIAGQEIDASWVEYAIEPSRTIVCLKQTGFTSLGSEDTRDTQAQLIAHPLMASLLKEYEDVLRALSEQTAGGPTTLQRLAVSQRLDPAEYV